MAKGYYVPRANFFYTFVTSAILFFIAGKQALDPQLIVPGFSKKYQSGRLGSEVENGCLVELNRLLEEEKIFLQPDLKLSTLARQLGVAPQQLSMLINEKFGKSYTDLINQRRVEAFISFRKDPHYAHYSKLALAYEVGFNSKSAFNAAFKKATGMAPSDFLK